VAFVGRAVPEKGMAEAARIAREAGVPIRMAAKVRHRGEREYFEAEVRPLLGRGVEFVGEVDPVDRLTLLQGARALLNPIRWPEPFGLVMIEALACGTPVVTTLHGAAPEIVDDGVTGYLRNGTAELVAALGEIDRLDRQACRASAELRFSTQRMVRDHLLLYEDLLAGVAVAGSDGPARSGEERGERLAGRGPDPELARTVD
jgi:glycosyltransferase involved in cell wall biosynthesis